MMPGHHFPASADPSPYALEERDHIKANVNYGNGDWIDFTVTGPIQGALFQVRDAMDRVVGELKSTDGQLKHMDCSGFNLGEAPIAEKGCLTHSQGNRKTQV